MTILRAALVLSLCWLAGLPAAAQDKRFVLVVPEALDADGLPGFLLPRFSLKTGVKITVEAAPPAVALVRAGTGDADMVLLDDPDAAAMLAAEGHTGAARAVFAKGETVYVAVIANPKRYPTARADLAGRFLKWLRSDVGRRTLAQFVPRDKVAYTPAATAATVEVTVAPTGDVDLGEELSLRNCGRCHVINEKNKFGGIGSTPSFGALRTLPRWLERFEAFWTLNPHPAFTQIEGVTPPFDPERPPPIAPLELTVKEVEAIVAFVSQMKPKDLGGALVRQ